jgi:hypothetical protein
METTTNYKKEYSIAEANEADLYLDTKEKIFVAICYPLEPVPPQLKLIQSFKKPIPTYKPKSKMKLLIQFFISALKFKENKEAIAGAYAIVTCVALAVTFAIYAFNLIIN